MAVECRERLGELCVLEVSLVFKGAMQTWGGFSDVMLLYMVIVSAIPALDLTMTLHTILPLEGAAPLTAADCSLGVWAAHMALTALGLSLHIFMQQLASRTPLPATHCRRAP